MAFFRSAALYCPRTVSADENGQVQKSLADAAQVVLMLAGVDLVLGPLLTLVIAAPGKPRRVLMRDIAVIAVVQLSALLYGGLSLWNGRPLYYAFSENVLQLVQAYDIEPRELQLARQQRVQITPHWYDTPRWIWAPLPTDVAEDGGRRWLFFCEAEGFVEATDTGRRLPAGPAQRHPAHRPRPAVARRLRFAHLAAGCHL